MSRPIQALAPGFLGLLGLKNNGQLPPEMIDQLQPIIDQLPFMLLGIRETAPITAGINVLASSTNYAFPELVVPTNEVWWVHGYSVQLSVPAGQSWTGNAIHFTNNTLAIDVGPRETAGGAAIQLMQTQSIGGFLAAPGDRFGLVTAASAGAGAINAFGLLTLSRFPA